MRPSKLELAGFGSFREPTTFDFDGIDYFALVGPTGNGKSTVIDAMCFALYGKVARHDDRSVVSNIVSLGAIETRVRFTFSAGGNEYVAVRAIKVRKGSPKHDARLERADGEVLAASVRDFSAAIEQLLGLSFDDFTRCVALPQGEFQRFLHEEPAKRRSVLVRLLNLTHYERMGQRAREDASELNTRRSVLTEQRDKLTPVSDADALAAHRLVVDLQELQSRLDTDGPIDVSITEMIGGLNRAITTAQSSAEALVRIDIPQAAATLATEDAQARAQLVIAQTALASSTAQVVAIENGITAIGDVAAVERGLALWKQHHELAASLSVKQLASDTIDADLVAAQLAATNSQAVLVTVTDELERVRNENRAHALRSELHDGDSCPVCAQTITNLPEVDEPPEFSAASARAKAAKEHADAAERLRSRVLADQQQSHGAQTTMREQFARIEAQVRATSSAEALGEQQSEYQELQRALTSVREHLQVSARAERAAAQAVEASSKQSQEFQRAFDQQRDAVGHLKPPERDADDLVGSWATLRAWASEQHSAITTQVANLHVQLSQQRLSQESLRSAIIGQSTALNVAVRDFEQLPAALATALTTAEHAVAEQHRQRDAARDLDAQNTEVGTEHAVAKMVGDLLRTDGFVSWLVEEALVALIRDASTTLFQLSGGQYSLRQGTGSDFEIVDHTNGDQPRPVRSLSGGETFQASLALALALSDQLADLAAEGAPKLEAIFLDEGFGTLDPESLDTVATTLEALGMSGRMVGVVTHVRELAERIPVRFEITKINNTSHVEMITA